MFCLHNVTLYEIQHTVDDLYFVDTNILMHKLIHQDLNSLATRVFLLKPKYGPESQDTDSTTIKDNVDVGTGAIIQPF